MVDAAPTGHYAVRAVPVGTLALARADCNWCFGAFLPARLGRLALWMCAPVLLVAGGLAVCHAGVEWQWWPSPFPACHAAHVVGRTLAERWASMPLVPSKPCDAPTYLIPGLPVSMAVMGGVFTLVVFAGWAVGMVKSKKVRYF
ncbi:disulfide bond formation protein B [Acetobacter ghanensis]|uniref:Disulfide bond formation protein B n=1 Tax=Acetobacter ghanensis TaxID=431306 RepID=A0A0U5F1I4_9PROT|nr:disulfide bond formation protein B [Acetobacter ghanensis]